MESLTTTPVSPTAARSTNMDIGCPWIKRAMTIPMIQNGTIAIMIRAFPHELRNNASTKNIPMTAIMSAAFMSFMIIFVFKASPAISIMTPSGILFMLSMRFLIISAASTADIFAFLSEADSVTLRNPLR